jgi:hypothetical protein
LFVLGPAIRDRLTSPEFRPFAIVLANGERVKVRHPDSLTLPSMEVRGRRFYSSYLTLLETKDDRVIERTIAMPMIAQVLDEHRFNGTN